jgi:predicted N-acetyltransferase YhbS
VGEPAVYIDRMLKVQDMPAHIRPYTEADLNACLALFDSNSPPYFDAAERADYEQFLRDPADRGEYYVLEQGAEVVACGGVWVKDGGEGGQSWGGLSWGMVRGNLHGQGLGSQLTTYRLDQLRAKPEVQEIRIETSQLTEGYYAQFGFVTVQRRPDGFAPGLDEVKMVLKRSRS